jgi:hypothetical protein
MKLPISIQAKLYQDKKQIKAIQDQAGALITKGQQGRKKGGGAVWDSGTTNDYQSWTLPQFTSANYPESTFAIGYPLVSE